MKETCRGLSYIRSFDPVWQVASIPGDWWCNW